MKTLAFPLPRHRSRKISQAIENISVPVTTAPKRETLKVSLSLNGYERSYVKNGNHRLLAAFLRRKRTWIEHTTS